MEKNGNNGLLSVVLILILLIVTTVIVCAILFLNKDNNDEPKVQNIVAKENVTTGGNTKKDPKDIPASTDFDLKFLKMENGEENNLYSPLSIRYALYMLRDGADGETLEQIENALGDATKVDKYESIKKVLSFANGIFIKDDYKKVVKEDYIDKVKEDYDAEVKYDAFKNANSVNSWIEDKTLGQIKDLLVDSAVKQSHMILINALAIDMEWEEEFLDKDTYGKTFYLSNGEEILATTMNQKFTNDALSYFEDKDVIAVSMDLKEYDNNQLSFIAIMPKKEKLTDYVEDFEMTNLENIENNFKSAADFAPGVIVNIPKFSYDYELNLKEDLKKLGIEDAFEEDVADFTKMANSDSLYVNDAIHKANIDFSEKGVKAAAVTVFMMTDAAMMYEEREEPLVYNFDKPFLYFIKDKESEDIWFVGTMYEPNNWEDDQESYKGKY